jgi:hypothetical protein
MFANIRKAMNQAIEWHNFNPNGKKWEIVTKYAKYDYVPQTDTLTLIRIY